MHGSSMLAAKQLGFSLPRDDSYCNKSMMESKWNFAYSQSSLIESSEYQQH